MAVGLLVGASAWAEDTNTLLECGTTNAPWTNESLAKWTGKEVTIGGDGLYVQYSGSDNSDFATATTIAPQTNAIVKLAAVWRGRSNTGRAFEANGGIYFRYGNIVVVQNDQDQKHAYLFTGLNFNSIGEAKTTFTSGSYRVDIANCAWLKIEAEINTASNTLTSFTIKSEDGATTYVDVKDVSLSNPDYATVAFGFQKGGSHNTEKQEQLKSIVITETAQAVSIGNYTINYIYNNEVIKEEKGSTVVDAVINAESPITINGVKYYATDDATTSLTIAAGENVLNVNLRQANNYNYTVNAVDESGNAIKAVIATSGVEGDAKTIYIPKAFTKDDVVYETAEETTKIAIDGTADVTKAIVYKESDITYFFEETDFTLSKAFAATIEKDFFSNGSGGRLAANTYGYTKEVEGGVYRLVVAGCINTQTPTMTYGYRLNEENVELGESEAFANGSFAASKIIENVIIPEGASFCWMNNTEWNSNLYIDYVALTKVTNKSVTIDDAGWATLYTPYALDFSEVAGLTAYTATLSDNTITLTEVDNVPANTGVVLKGAAADYEIPVALSSETAKGDLKGSATAALTYSATATKDYYVLALNDDYEVQFTKLISGSIAAGKAYLEVPKPAANEATARTLEVVIAGETTGITEVEKANAESGAVYNLAGQRVAQPANGLYIVNGKKVIVK